MKNMNVKVCVKVDVKDDKKCRDEYSNCDGDSNCDVIRNDWEYQGGVRKYGKPSKRCSIVGAPSPLR